MIPDIQPKRRKAPKTRTKLRLSQCNKANKLARRYIASLRLDPIHSRR